MPRSLGLVLLVAVSSCAYVPAKPVDTDVPVDVDTDVVSPHDTADTGGIDTDAPADTDVTPDTDVAPDTDVPADTDGGSDPFGHAAACTASGGTVSTGICCQSTLDFPNTCAVGACGCAPQYSHTVRVCECPANTCWDGMTCQ